MTRKRLNIFLVFIRFCAAAFFTEHGNWLSNRIWYCLEDTLLFLAIICRTWGISFPSSIRFYSKTCIHHFWASGSKCLLFNVESSFGLLWLWTWWGKRIDVVHYQNHIPKNSVVEIQLSNQEIPGIPSTPQKITEQLTSNLTGRTLQFFFLTSLLINFSPKPQFNTHLCSPLYMLAHNMLRFAIRYKKKIFFFWINYWKLFSVYWKMINGENIFRVIFGNKCS